ncbi:MAG: hypothetical protein HQL58_07495 [Magnetococcales bacterium]|nr:hypothetical protein [Magnetococcales bacterium]
MVTVELSEEFEQGFSVLSHETGRSVGDLIHDALECFLEEWQDKQDAILADRLLQEFEESGESGIPFEELLKESGFTLDDIR